MKAVATVLVAHGLGYVLTGVLPKVGIGVLGVGAADPTALAHFGAKLDVPQNYLEALSHLLVGDLGRTVDQVSVASALAAAIVRSLPVLFIATAVFAGCTLLALFWPQRFATAGRRGVFEFLTFIPVFMPSFVVFAVAVMTGAVAVFEDGQLRTLILGICVGVTPSCLSISTICHGYELELKRRYVKVMHAYGYDRQRLNAGVRKAILIHWIPTLEKIVTLQIAVLIFTEAIFSFPGFGSLILLAVQRTDVNVILAAIVGISLIISIIRLVAAVALSLLEPADRKLWVS